MRRVALGLLVGVCAWSLAGPALAQSAAVPANAPVVASVGPVRLPPVARQCGYTASNLRRKTGGGRSTAAGHRYMMSDVV
jgi:hypothetical protein